MARGAAWVVAARVAICVPGGSLPQCLRWLDGLAARLPAAPSLTLDEAVWAVTAAARRVPRTRCLAWALALRGLLAQTGRASELRIGVRRRWSPSLEAHAWIECGGRVLSWGDVAGFRVLRPRAAV